MGRPGTFPPGQSGNRRGRPKKGTALTDLLRTYLNAKDPGDLVARKKKLVEELYRRAIGGWVSDPADSDKREYVRGSDDLLRYLFNRLDGNPMQATEVTGKDGGPLMFASLTQEEREKLLAEELDRRIREG